LRLIAQTLGLCRIDAASEAIVLQFGIDSTVEPQAIIRYLQSQRDVRMTGSDRIRVTLNDADVTTRIQRIRAICKALQPRPVTA
jgi:transcription-repair coupling factor (superfamily II helicase)